MFQVPTLQPTGRGKCQGSPVSSTTSGYQFYDKNQAIACSKLCIMLSGLIRYHLVITFSDIIIIITGYFIVVFIVVAGYIIMIFIIIPEIFHINYDYYLFGLMGSIPKT